MIRGLTLALVLAVAPAGAQELGATRSDSDLAAALLACQSEFAGPTVNCDAIIGGSCHYTYEVPACYAIERQYNAPGGLAERIRNNRTWQREADRQFIERVAK